jgi:putative ABC transport system permease protein
MRRGTLVIAFLTLTLAIAAATTTFSVVDAVALRHLPFPDDDRLVSIARVSVTRPEPGVVAPQDYFGWRDGTTAFATLGATGAWSSSRLPASAAGETQTTRRITANFFEVLGVAPMIGRGFRPDEEIEGATPLVAVISHRLWATHFGGDPGVLGTTVSLGREERQIVGVMPPRFTYPVGRETFTDIWIPWVPTARERDPATPGRGFYLEVVGRLRDGATLAQAKADVDRVRDAMAEDPRSSWTDARAHTVPLKDFVIGAAKGWMALALGAVAIVLLVACANVANLLLARATARQRDLAVRAALGASRGRLVRGVLAESLGLAAASAAAGVLLAVWGVDVVRAALPEGLARASDIAVNLRVLGAAALAAGATALICGLAPAWQTSRVDVVTLIKGDGAAGRTALSGGSRLRSLFLVAEVALVVMLIVGASLFVTSFVRVMHVDLGFEPEGLVAFPVDWQGRSSTPEGSSIGVKVEDPDKHNEIARVWLSDVIDRVMAVPGVTAAGIYEGGRPLGGGGVRFSIEGFGSGRGEDTVEMRAISPGYLDAARMQVIAGRPILASDAVGGARVALVNDVVASQYFPDRNPVGQVFDFRGPVEIVGVVRAVRAAGPEVDPRPEIFFPLTQHTRNWSTGLPLAVVRVDRPLGAVVPALQAALRDVQPQAETARQPFLYAEALGRLTAQRRFSAGLMTVFGVLALVIGAAGVYAVMAFVVARQTREMGIRVALGASRARVLTLVLSQAGQHVAIGVLLGLLAAWVLSRGLASVLFGVSASDPVVYVAAATIVAFVGLTAALMPAIRATRVDPAVTLRVE